METIGREIGVIFFGVCESPKNVDTGTRVLIFLEIFLEVINIIFEYALGTQFWNYPKTWSR